MRAVVHSEALRFIPSTIYPRNIPLGGDGGAPLDADIKDGIATGGAVFALSLIAAGFGTIKLLVCCTGYTLVAPKRYRRLRGTASLE